MIAVILVYWPTEEDGVLEKSLLFLWCCKTSPVSVIAAPFSFLSWTLQKQINWKLDRLIGAPFASPGLNLLIHLLPIELWLEAVFPFRLIHSEVAVVQRSCHHSVNFCYLRTLRTKYSGNIDVPDFPSVKWGQTDRAKDISLDQTVRFQGISCVVTLLIDLPDTFEQK